MRDFANDIKKVNAPIRPRYMSTIITSLLTVDSDGVMPIDSPHVAYALICSKIRVVSVVCERLFSAISIMTVLMESTPTASKSVLIAFVEEWLLREQSKYREWLLLYRRR